MQNLDYHEHAGFIGQIVPVWHSKPLLDDSSYRLFTKYSYIIGLIKNPGFIRGVMLSSMHWGCMKMVRSHVRSAGTVNFFDP